MDSSHGISSKSLQARLSRFASQVAEGKNTEATMQRKNKIKLGKQAAKMGVPMKTYQAIEAMLHGNKAAQRVGKKALYARIDSGKPEHRDTHLLRAADYLEKRAAKGKQQADAIRDAKAQHQTQIAALTKAVKAAKQAGSSAPIAHWRLDKLTQRAAAYEAKSDRLEALGDALHDLHSAHAKQLRSVEKRRSGRGVGAFKPAPLPVTEDPGVLRAHAKQEAKRRAAHQQALTYKGRAKDAQITQHKQWGLTQAAHKVRKAVLSPVGLRLAIAGDRAALHGAQMGRAIQLVGRGLFKAVLAAARLVTAPLWHPMQQAVPNGQARARSLSSPAWPGENSMPRSEAEAGSKAQADQDNASDQHDDVEDTRSEASDASSGDAESGGWSDVESDPGRP